MYFGSSEHNPPHFHVVYGEYAGVFDIQSLIMTEGDLPAKAQELVKECAHCIRMICKRFGIPKSSAKFHR